MKGYEKGWVFYTRFQQFHRLMLQNTRETPFRTSLVTDHTLPLGRDTGYPNKYEPNVLFPIARSESRESFVSGRLPFDGVDIWNAWELTWLSQTGLPVVATAEIRIPATSPNLIESKSLKLYLNSFAMSCFDSAEEVERLIIEDLGKLVGTQITAQIQLLAEIEASSVSRLPGRCLDSLAVTCTHWEVDAALLDSDPDTEVEEDLHSHLLRSLCPVTGQPDIGSIAIHYRGPRIDPASLLQYIVSFREHNDFHEACIERMFVDILDRCQSEKLSIHARYQRRGGIDINPFRSNFQEAAENLRLWRQ
jgi:7-cyano-7-deazaguanine reductase